jgi:hypothetical protein
MQNVEILARGWKMKDDRRPERLMYNEEEMALCKFLTPF